MAERERLEQAASNENATAAALRAASSPNYASSQAPLAVVQCCAELVCSRVRERGGQLQNFVGVLRVEWSRLDPLECELLLCDAVHGGGAVGSKNNASAASSSSKSTARSMVSLGGFLRIGLRYELTVQPAVEEVHAVDADATVTISTAQHTTSHAALYPRRP